MAWQHTFEKKGYGPRAFRKEGSKASRGNVERDVVDEPVGAGHAKKRKVFKRFGIECRWVSIFGTAYREWGVWSWHETERQRDYALARLQRRPDILKRQYRMIDR